MVFYCYNINFYRKKFISNFFGKVIVVCSIFIVGNYNVYFVVFFEFREGVF